jgi:hypothetical protein
MQIKNIRIRKPKLALDGGRSQAPVLVSKEEMPYKERMGDSQEDTRGSEENKMDESTEQEDRAENHGGVRDGGVENSVRDGETNQEDIPGEGVGVNDDRCAPTPNCLGDGWEGIDKNKEDKYETPDIDQRDTIRKETEVKEDRCAPTPNCLWRGGKLRGEGGCTGAERQGLKRRIKFWEEDIDKDGVKDIRKEWGHPETTMDMAHATSSNLEQLGRFDSETSTNITNNSTNNVRKMVELWETSGKESGTAAGVKQRIYCFGPNQVAELVVGSHFKKRRVHPPLTPKSDPPPPPPASPPLDKSSWDTYYEETVFISNYKESRDIFLEEEEEEALIINGIV